MAARSHESPGGSQDRYMEAAATFRAAPTKENAEAVAEAYREFYRKLTGSLVGFEEALAELGQRMLREIERACVRENSPRRSVSHGR